MLQMQCRHVVRSSRSRVFRRLDSVSNLTFVEGSEVRVKFMRLVEFSEDFAGGGVLLMGLDACELFGKTGSNGGRFGERFIVEVDWLIWWGVGTFARKGAE